MFVGIANTVVRSIVTQTANEFMQVALRIFIELYYILFQNGSYSGLLNLGLCHSSLNENVS
jgi:hypothetical protein